MTTSVSDSRGPDDSETSDAQKVHPATAGEFSPLVLGPLRLWPPVVLAPMAAVTTAPFRTLCRRFGAPLCISEMIAARPLVEGNEKTWRLASFDPEERPRSIQLYGVDPDWIGRAVALLVERDIVDHIDLNFGCPVRKVTCQGGGAALPHRPQLMGRLLAAAVRNAGSVPVTVKFRMGIDDDHLVYLRTGHIAEDSGCAAVTLHARTAAQHYDGTARWEAIAQLTAELRIPVLGNGDIWEGADALRMMRETKCQGVVVGRGCLGRPWLFDDILRLFAGSRPSRSPTLGTVVDLMLQHLEMLASVMGRDRGLMAFRRHATWYTKGFRGSTELREQLTRAPDIEAFQQLLSRVDRSLPFPRDALRVRRGKRSTQHTVVLPPGYLDTPEENLPPPTETDADGG